MTGVDTVTIGGSGLITSGTVNVSGLGGNDAISVLGDTTVIDAATITINGGDGDDTITLTGDNADFVTTANTTITVDGGAGTDTLSLGDLAGTDLPTSHWVQYQFPILKLFS